MGKRIDIDGKSYRMRRGKLVEIPPEWLGRITTQETIRQRPSKLDGKVKRATKNGGMIRRYKDGREQPLEDQ